MIRPAGHGILDFTTVLAFALLPIAFGFTGIPAYLSYALAAIHLLLTLLTNFPLGVIRKIPFKIHGWIEMAVGPILLGSPWILGFSEDTTARYVFMATGTAIIGVAFLTDYSKAP